MERNAILKIVTAALAFCAVFVGLTALGLYILDSVLTDEKGESARTDYPLEEKHITALDTPGRPPPVHDRVAPPPLDVAVQIELLGSSMYRVRVDAESRLVRMGTRAVPHLEQAMRHPDPEVRWRAKEAIRRIREGR
ncbi:MAG: HEAT repeat domain-containing protein [Planctomycetota bacterium]|jgi:hypothetical protein